jgi:hypothetical protein
MPTSGPLHTHASPNFVGRGENGEGFVPLDKIHVLCGRYGRRGIQIVKKQAFGHGKIVCQSPVDGPARVWAPSISAGASCGSCRPRPWSCRP